MNMIFTKEWWHSPSTGVTNVYRAGWVYPLNQAVADLAVAAGAAHEVAPRAPEPTPKPEGAPEPALEPTEPTPEED